MDLSKPIPKTQKEILISQQEPYIPPDGAPGFSPVGNPNLNNNPNRSDQISFRNDTTKPFSIGIQDIDEAVFYYFQNVIKPFVIQNEARIEVPVIYGSPERWKSFQKDGYYRDSQGRIMMPLIMFKRNTVTKIRSVTNKLDANNPHNISVQGKKYSSRNSYDNFNLLNDIKPQKEYYAVVVPDFIDIVYNCVISTYYVDQLTKLVEMFEYASDSYWGDPTRFQFRAMIDSFTTANELSDTQERVVTGTFDIKLHGHIIPDVIQKDLTARKKIPSINNIIINEQTINNINQ